VPSLPRCGIILAGGESRRMGRDKAFVEIDGETLAARTARIVAGICDVVVVVGAPGRALPPLPSGIVEAFDDERFQGPLAGITAGLAALPTDVAGHVLVVPVDMPRLSDEPLRALLVSAVEGRAAALEREGRIEPLPAWLPLARLRELMNRPRSDRSLQALLRELAVVGVASVEGGETLRDADEENDLAL